MIFLAVQTNNFSIGEKKSRDLSLRDVLYTFDGDRDGGRRGRERLGWIRFGKIDFLHEIICRAINGRSASATRFC